MKYETLYALTIIDDRPIQYSDTEGYIGSNNIKKPISLITFQYVALQIWHTSQIRTEQIN